VPPFIFKLIAVLKAAQLKLGVLTLRIDNKIVNLSDTSTLDEFLDIESKYNRDIHSFKESYNGDTATYDDHYFFFEEGEEKLQIPVTINGQSQIIEVNSIYNGDQNIDNLVLGTGAGKSLVLGTDGVDIFTQVVGDTLVLTGAENDYITVLGGNVTVLGGDGEDTVEFVEIGVTVDLTENTATLHKSFGRTDIVTLDGVENITSSYEKDTFIGNTNNNTFRGGDEHDTYIFKGAFGRDRIVDYDGGEVIINGTTLKGVVIKGEAQNEYTLTHKDGSVFILNRVDASDEMTETGANLRISVKDSPVDSSGKPINSVTIKDFDFDNNEFGFAFLGGVAEETVTPNKYLLKQGDDFHVISRVNDNGVMDKEGQNLRISVNDTSDNPEDSVIIEDYDFVNGSHNIDLVQPGFIETEEYEYEWSRITPLSKGGYVDIIRTEDKLSLLLQIYNSDGTKDGNIITVTSKPSNIVKTIYYYGSGEHSHADDLTRDKEQYEIQGYGLNNHRLKPVG